MLTQLSIFIVGLIGAAALAFLPSVAYDRHAKKTEALTYTVVREF